MGKKVFTFFCSPFELLHVCSTAYRPDNSKGCAFWNAESLFFVSWRNCCQTCLFILGATTLVQFSGLRYLFCTYASLSLGSSSNSRLFTISAKFESMAGAVFSATLNPSASDLKESPLDPSPRSEGCIKLSILVATAVSALASGFS